MFSIFVSLLGLFVPVLLGHTCVFFPLLFVFRHVLKCVFSSYWAIKCICIFCLLYLLYRVFFLLPLSFFITFLFLFSVFNSLPLHILCTGFAAFVFVLLQCVCVFVYSFLLTNSFSFLLLSSRFHPSRCSWPFCSFFFCNLATQKPVPVCVCFFPSSQNCFTFVHHTRAHTHTHTHIYTRTLNPVYYYYY